MRSNRMSLPLTVILAMGFVASAEARFLSTDPADTGKVGSSQSWNRYSYVQNNPAGRVDPTGMMDDVPNTMTGEAFGKKPQMVGDATPQQSAITAACMYPLVGVMALGGVAAAVELAPAALPVATSIALSPSAAQVGQHAVELANPNPGSLAVGGAGQLAQRASQVHEVLDPIAQNMRTTAALATTAETIIAGGARDLSPAQRAALGAGEVAARFPGAHAEVTALEHAAGSGLLPRALAVTRDICPSCAVAIERVGGVLTGARTAEWP